MVLGGKGGRDSALLLTGKLWTEERQWPLHQKDYLPHPMRSAKTDDIENTKQDNFVSICPILWGLHQPPDQCHLWQLFSKPYYIYLELSLTEFCADLEEDVAIPLMKPWALICLMISRLPSHLFNWCWRLSIAVDSLQASRIFSSRPGASEKYWPLGFRAPRVSK